MKYLLALIFVAPIAIQASWQGVYTYSTKDKKDNLEVHIGEVEYGVYSAFFVDKGASNFIKYKCKIESISESKIELYVVSCIKGDAKLKNQDIILGLEKVGDSIVTNWGAINLVHAKESGKPYLRLDPSRIDYMFKYHNQLPYEVGFFKDKWITGKMKELIPTKFDGLLSFLQVEKAIKVKNNILTLEGISADKKGLGNSGKNILVIDIEKQALFLTMIDGKGQMHNYQSKSVQKPSNLTSWINKNK